MSEEKEIEEIGEYLCKCTTDFNISWEENVKELAEKLYKIGFKIPKHGTWERRYRYSTIWHFCCSECHKTSAHSQKRRPTNKICPHCGALMELGE
jgi:hypothetical protein